MKVVINRSFGGFDLSDKAMLRLAELKGIKVYPEKTRYNMSEFWRLPAHERTPEMDEKFYGELTFSYYGIERDDIDLVQTVEELGETANGCFSNLHVITIPDDVKWHIIEHAGNERIAENHRTWS